MVKLEKVLKINNGQVKVSANKSEAFLKKMGLQVVRSSKDWFLVKIKKVEIGGESGDLQFIVIAAFHPTFGASKLNERVKIQNEALSWCYKNMKTDLEKAIMP